jgi:O-glycosyl hydrolase
MFAATLLAAALLAGCSGSSGSSGGGASGTAQTKVTVSALKQYQRIAGFGVSEGFGQAKTLMSAPAAVQQQVLSLLYSPTRGAGLTILRNEISADTGFTIEPKAPSSPAGQPSYLTLAEVDQDQGQLWFAKQIKADYGVSDVFADAWSAPGFMKTNGSAINGGTLCGVPGANCKSGDWRQAYANYLVQYAKGLDVTAFRNTNGSTAVIVLNTTRSSQVASFSLRGRTGGQVTPYLTDTSHGLSAQSPITVSNSTFTATLPPRSLVTYDIRS